MIPNNQFWFNNNSPVFNRKWTDNHIVLGDSISDTTYPYCVSGSYAKKTIDYLGITYTDLAVPSSGIYQSIIAQMQQSVPLINSTSLMSGLNDIRNSNTSKTFEMVKGGIISILSLAYAKNVKFFANPLHFTQDSGTWVNGNNGLESKAWYYSSGTYGWMASNTLNAKLSGTFNGDKIAIGTYGQNAARGILEIKVDGVIVNTFDCTAKCNTVTSINISGFYYSPYAFVLNGFGNGSHTIEVKNTNGDYVFLDYLVELYNFNEETNPFCYLEIPYLNNSAYGMYAPYNDATELGISNLNTFIDSELSFFKNYNTFNIIKTNDFYDPNTSPTQVDADLVHPNCLGSQNISTAIINTF